MRSPTARLLLPAALATGLLLAMESATEDDPGERRAAEASVSAGQSAAGESVAEQPAEDSTRWGPTTVRLSPRAADTRPLKTRRRPHAVLLVLDELPSDSLLGEGGTIDAGRYPNFAELAATSTWFPNGYSTYDSTTKAVPLILDGIRPSPGSAPDVGSHPVSIFTALGRRGYRVVAAEEATALCPPSVCPGARTQRPAIIPRLNRGRPERYARFVRSIRPRKRPTFWMKHVLLPHGPYLYLPSGARARPGARDLVPGMNSELAFHHDYLTRHNEQRYLLQLGYVDRLLGRLLRRLKQSGMYDDTLVMVTADHGLAWQVGVSTRRSVSPANVHELTPVPFFVKAPGQRVAKVSRAYAQTLDVTPTIADVLGVRLGYRADGRSAFSRAVQRRRGVAVTTRDFSGVVRIAGRRWRALRRAVVRRRLRQFGSGDWASLYAGTGPNRALLGRVLGGLARAAAGGVRASISRERAFANVRRPRGIVPSQVAGRLRGGRDATERNIAVAVNGRIEAVGRSFHLIGDATEHYGVNVPEDALTDGRNTVEVFEVTRAGVLRPLARS
jgi:Sulfatase